MADTVNDSLRASNYSGIQLMPPTAAEKKGEVNWGHPRPRQEDCVPLHSLLKSYAC